MNNNSFRLAAALAYNTIFSLPPLLLLIVTLAGYFFGEKAISGELYMQTKDAIGPDAAESIQTMLKNVQIEQSGLISTIIGVGTLLLAATTFFVTLQESLNTVWNIKVRPENGILKLAKDRLLSFGMILGIALLMLVSFLVSAVIAILSDYLRELIPGIGYYFTKIIDFVLSVGIITLLFALIYRFLPDGIIRWKDTLVGAGITALLFVIGKFLISWYIGNSDPGSAYGAAGSVILILIWVYYSSMIVFYGAEFTQQYASRFGVAIKPKPHAMKVKEIEVDDTEDTSRQQGRPPADGKFRK